MQTQGLNDSKRAIWIDRIIWLTACFMPLGFFPFPGIDIFDVVKGPLITIAGLSLFVLLVKEKRFDKSIEAKLLYLYMFLVFLASLFALEPLLAFVGALPTNIIDEHAYGRYEGFITILAYGILFYSAKNYIVITKKKINYLLTSLSIIGFYAIIQHFQYDPLVLYMNYPRLIFSTIGNQNFLASLMVMTIPLPCAMFILSNEKKKNTINLNSLFYLFVAFILFSALIASKTRSAWIAFSLIFLLSILYCIIKQKHLFHLFIIILTFGLSIAFLNIEKSNSVSINKKALSIKEEINSQDEYGGSGRIKIWQITLKVVRKHPLLGAGPENLKPAMKRECKTDLQEYWRKKRTTIDKAHNEYLHVAAVNGIPALLVLLCIYFYCYRNIYKNILSNKNLEQNFLIFLMITAYLAQATFNISVIAVAPVFWILLGVCLNKNKLIENN